jgi:hypothetical protein
MSLVSSIRGLRHRLSEQELEKAINLLDDERKRRGLVRSDELINTKRLKEV